jgi:hypothetical protein
MTLNLTGPISIAGTTAGQSIQIELGGTGSTQMSLNCATVRTLAGVPSGAIVMPTNFYGKSSSIPFGCATYTTAGTYSFVVPTGATKICVVCVGGGASGQTTCCCASGIGGVGGGLSYTNCISTTPGETLTVVVGAGGVAPPLGGLGSTNGCPSYVNRGGTTLIRAAGGGVSNTSTGVGSVKYNGGTSSGGGGSGAAGYAGNGGNSGFPPTAGTGGSGGGGGGPLNLGTNNRSGSGGGGVGLVVLGANGTAGTNASGTGVRVGGGGGSSGTAGTNATSTVSGQPGSPGGPYGGGGGGGAESCGVGGVGAKGGIRIIYGGTGKTYPSNSA